MQTQWWYWIVSALVILGAALVLARAFAKMRAVHARHMALLVRVERTAHMLSVRAAAGDTASSEVSGVLPSMSPPGVVVVPEGVTVAPPGEVPVRFFIQPPSPLDNVIVLSARKASAGRS